MPSVKIQRSRRRVRPTAFPEAWTPLFGRSKGIALIFFTLVGCGDPKPLVLEQNLEVYRDDIEGFSFRPPEGWLQQSRARVPKADRGQERLLIKYKRSTGNQLGVFQVSAVDLPADTNVTAYLDQSFGKNDKRTSTKPDLVQIGGLPGTRETFISKWDRETVVKEVVFVRRGPRVYFFTSVVAPSDKPTREAMRKILESIEWQDERKD